MNDINIYLPDYYKKELSRLCNQHKLSMSSVCDIISYWTLEVWGKYGYESKPNILTDYLMTGKKTHVKPKRIGRDPMEANTKSHLISNAVIIYINNDMKLYVNEKGEKIYRENILKELKETKEDFWNFNKFARSQGRFIRQNPEYVRKLLNEKN